MGTTERDLHHMNGYLAVVAVIALVVGGLLLVAGGAADGPGDNGSPAAIWLGIALIAVAALSLRGFVVVAPNESKVVTLLGKYRGTLRDAGFHWINPFTTRQSVSLRVRNLDSDTLKVNDAALNGELSSEQLHPAADLADESTDEEWSRRAKKAAPADLQRMARKRRAMSREESMARRARRSLRKWRDDHGFLHGRFELPLEHGGAEVEAFFDQVAERMRPAKGERWASLEHRHADTLIGLCTRDAPVDGSREHRDAEDRAQGATMAARPMVVVDVPLNGPATLYGIPLPEEWLDAWRAEVKVQLRAVDTHGMPVADGSIRKFVSDKRRRSVIRRDGRCRWPGCRRRLGLQVHHLLPSSWGGSDDIANLAAVCPAHHALLIPHGEYILDGNPNQPDGLELRRISAEERRRRSPAGMTLAT